MMRSLYSGVSGLRNHQTRMDVIGNNIANVNTVGFKASRTIFHDMYSQNMRAASSPGETTGGTNPQQIGLGVTLSTIDTLFTRSAAQVTGNTYDLMIENDGFFVVRNGYGDAFEEFYTRAGNFYEDKEHYLVTANGFYLMGYKAQLMEGPDPIPETKASVNVPAYIPGSFTDDDNDATTPDVKSPYSGLPAGIDASWFEIMTGQGADVNGHEYVFTLTKDGKLSVETWITTNSNTVPAERQMVGKSDPITIVNNDPVPAPPALADSNDLVVPVGEMTVTIKPGQFTSANLAALFGTSEDPINFYLTAGPSYLNAAGAAVVSGIDAEPRGEPTSIITGSMDRINIDENLYNVSIDKNGNVTALVKSSGIITCPMTGDQIRVEADQRVTIARVAVATFDNQQGLEKVGTNLYRSTANTGEAQYKSPGVDGAGAINPGALEMSNVDLSQEFTDMIVTQRGFQANSRIITVSDSLLEELVNLKR